MEGHYVVFNGDADDEPYREETERKKKNNVYYTYKKDLRYIDKEKINFHCNACDSTYKWTILCGKGNLMHM